MERFFKVEDPTVIKAFFEKLEIRSKFIKDWDAEGVRRGFTAGHLVDWRFDRIFDICADGFLATKTQLKNRDKAIYKAGRHYEKTNDYVVKVKVSNKKAYKEYQEQLSHNFDGQIIENLFYEKPNSTWGSYFREVNWNFPNVILIKSIKDESENYKLKPCLIEIKNSEYLALQGK